MTFSRSLIVTLLELTLNTAVMLGTIITGWLILIGKNNKASITFWSFLIFFSTRMKWRAIEPNQGDFITEKADNMIAWAHSNNITVRGIHTIKQRFEKFFILAGHSLLWAKSQNNPDFTRELFGDEFKNVVYKHLDDTMDHFNSLDIVHWDVINEMIDQGAGGHTFYIDQSGDENIRAEIHQYVKQKYPQNMFYINDYGIIDNRYNRFSLFQQLLRDLFASGVVIDGIGLQSHLDGTINYYLQCSLA